MRTVWSRSEIQGRELVWLLDFAYAGQTFRLSSRPITVPSDDGDIPYVGHLGECVVTSSVDLFSDSPTPPKASLEILFPVDVPELVMAGHRLGSARVEISQVRVATQDSGTSADDWEDRRVVLRGKVRDPGHGTAADPIRFTVSQDLWEDTASLPEVEAVTSQARFPSDSLGTSIAQLLSDADVGLPYPVIFGNPGLDPQAPGGWITGSEAVWLNKTTGFHALGLCGYRVAATQVRINCDDNVYGQLFNVSHGFDDRGREVAYIGDLATGAGAPLTAHNGLEDAGANIVPPVYQPAVATSVRVFVGWPSGGGVIGRNGEAIRGAGDVVEWVLQRTSAPVDFGKVATAAPGLNRFNIDASIDAFTKPMGWLSSQILPLLPCSLAVGVSGLYPLVWRYDAGPDDALGHLDADSDTRLSVGPTVEVDNSRILNDFTLRYGRSARTGTFTHEAHIGAAYVQRDRYATGHLPQRLSDPAVITVRSLNAGDRPRVTVVDGGAASVTDVPAAGRVDVVFVVGDTVNTVRNTINGSTMIEAFSDSTAVFSGVAWPLDITLVADDPSTLQDYYCAVSVAREADPAQPGSGVFPETMESQAIYDRETAYAVLGWRARAFALEHRTVNVLAPFGEWGWLQLGDTVLVTRTAIGLSREVAFVEDIEEGSDGMIGFRLRMIEDPMRDMRS